jgi:polyhydroxyalkanoate synthesis regulator phasin
MDDARRSELQASVRDLVDVAVETGELTAATSDDDLSELFQDMCEMYLGDLNRDEARHARACFDAAVAQLKTVAASP